jgi:SpoVK/Ycf46/Vps4 family AAA+-type ATPase
MAIDLKDDLRYYLKAGFPALYIQSHEEDRVIEQVVAAAKEVGNGREVFMWTVTKGWVQYMGEGKTKLTNETTEPRAAIEIILKMKEDAAYVMKDFHDWIEEPTLKRAIRDIVPQLKATGKTLVIVASRVVIPTELEKEITLVTLDLPNIEQLSKIFDDVVSTVGEAKAKVENKDKMLEAAKGLSAFEAEQTYAFALAKHSNLSNDAIATVMREKAGIIKKTGILEFYEPDAKMQDVGGLAALKGWLNKRKRAFTPEARKYGLVEPKGLLMVGVQGCGKSLTAKAVAADFMLPLLRLDVGRVFGALVGQSEENMRKALSIAEAVAPCVVWLDELEKGLSGLASSGQTDSGVTARVFGTLLTWMSEKKAPVYIVATCNDISALPAEMIRKGRFDEIFFVDLPTQTERAEIFEIHLRKRKRDPKKFNVGKLAMTADQFSGAEIEEAINSAMFDAFDDDKEVTNEHVVRSIETSPPLAMTAPEKIKKTREEALKNKWRRATEVISTQVIPKRKVESE